MAAIDGVPGRRLHLAAQPPGTSEPEAAIGATAVELAGLVKLFVRALRALGESGRPSDASRLAAEGWSLLRSTEPEAAERLGGLLHYLARLPSASADSQPAALTKERPS